MTRRKKHEEPNVFNRLKHFRKLREMSRTDLAGALGIHYQTIGYLERGEYKPSLVIALNAAALFGVAVEDIFSLSNFEETIK